MFSKQLNNRRRCVDIHHDVFRVDVELQQCAHTIGVARLNRQTKPRLAVVVDSVLVDAKRAKQQQRILARRSLKRRLTKQQIRFIK